jgi:hypothetical protein
MQGSTFPYSPIGTALHHLRSNNNRRRQTARACVICICFAILLGFLVLVALKRIHSMHIFKIIPHVVDRSHARICMGYPNKTLLINSPASHFLEKQYFVSLKEFTMSPLLEDSTDDFLYHLQVDEIIPARVKNQWKPYNHYNHQFLHRYMLSNSRNNCTIELLFLNYLHYFHHSNRSNLSTISQTNSKVVKSRRKNPVHNDTNKLKEQNNDYYVALRKLWSSPNLNSMQEQVNTFSIPSARLKSAAVLYFQAIHNFGTVVYLDPLATCDTIYSNYNFFDDNNQYIGYSSVDSRVYKGINTATKDPCLERINLAHAYLFGNQNQILGILAMADMEHITASLRKCNSVGTVDFATTAILNFSISARRLFSVSPVFVDNCT